MYLSRRNAGESPAGTSGVTCSMTGGGRVDRHEVRSQPRSAWPLPHRAVGLAGHPWAWTSVPVHRTAPARRGSHRAAGGRGAHAGASGRDIQEPASRRRVFLPARATGRIFTRDCDDRMITVCRSLPRCKGSMGRRPDIAHEEPAGGAAAHCVAGVGQELLVQYFIRKWVLQC